MGCNGSKPLANRSTPEASAAVAPQLWSLSWCRLLGNIIAIVSIFWKAWGSLCLVPRLFVFISLVSSIVVARRCCSQSANNATTFVLPCRLSLFLLTFLCRLGDKVSSGSFIHLHFRRRKRKWLKNNENDVRWCLPKGKNGEFYVLSSLKLRASIPYCIGEGASLF